MTYGLLGERHQSASCLDKPRILADDYFGSDHPRTIRGFHDLGFVGPRGQGCGTPSFNGPFMAYPLQTGMILRVAPKLCLLDGLKERHRSVCRAKKLRMKSAQAGVQRCCRFWRTWNTNIHPMNGWEKFQSKKSIGKFGLTALLHPFAEAISGFSGQAESNLCRCRWVPAGIFSCPK